MPSAPILAAIRLRVGRAGGHGTSSVTSAGVPVSSCVNGGVHVTGLPIPQKSDGFHYNIYRLAVDGLDAGPIYQISYKGQKARTFKLYEGREQQDRYRDRYGSYF